MENFPLPEQQNASIQIQLAPPAPISGWGIQFDLCWRAGSASPLWSAYLASGYNGQSGITIVNGATGVYSVTLGPYAASGAAVGVSGSAMFTNVLYYRTYRSDSGYITPIADGFRLMPPI